MPEHIMSYDLDENGKLINAKRQEEIVRCKDCEWYRYPMLTDNSLNTKPIPNVITDIRRCERGWCDKDFCSYAERKEDA